MKKNIGYADYRLSPLKIITAKAKAIRKAHPKMLWSQAIKKASALYKSSPKKVGSIKKAKAKKTVIKKISKSKPVVSKKVEHLSLASLKSEAAKRLKSKLGELVVKKYMAVTKREKARLQKEITIDRRELKKYC